MSCSKSSIIHIDWYKDKNVVVTGGAGFIGSHLSETLVELGSEVCIIDDLSAGREENIRDFVHAVRFVKADIRDENAVNNCLRNADVVFHLAANASVPLSVKHPKDDFSRNAYGTLNILSCLTQHNVQSIVVASSGAVYGQPTSFPITEEHSLCPISPYGASKASAEALCEAFHSSFNLPIRIARIFNTYGPRQPRFVMYDFFRKLYSDPTYLEILGDGSQVRDFCYVSDTVDALLRIAQLGDGPCTAFNVSAGNSYTVVEVAQALISIMKLERVQLGFTGSSWEGDATHWEVSIDKLVRHTGYAPRYDLMLGLTHFVDWFTLHLERLL